jgi:HD-GYP domain-containing protein (c-di-GMP phosphodiesterase class II)
VLHHHERWDGTGYPDGLEGDEIPLGARIIFVADAFDAMTSDRVYRQRLSLEEAFAELDRCAGSQFDPEVVAAFAAEVGVGQIAAAV